MGTTLQCNRRLLIADFEEVRERNKLCHTGDDISLNALKGKRKDV
jgi:hypothetical protein